VGVASSTARCTMKRRAVVKAAGAIVMRGAMKALATPAAKAAAVAAAIAAEACEPSNLPFVEDTAGVGATLLSELRGGVTLVRPGVLEIQGPSFFFFS